MHWASVLTLISIGISLLFLISLAALLSISSLIDLFNQTGDAAASMIGAFSFGFLALLLLICGWFVLQKTRGMATADQPFTLPFSPWGWVVLPAVAFISILVGGLITLAEFPWLNWIVLPLLTLLVIVPPIWLLFGIASKGIELGPRWQFFSIFSLSITVAPVVMIVLEILALIFIISIGVVFAAIAHPELVGEIERMSLMFNESMDEEALLAMLAPYLTNPLLIAAGMGYIAFIVPLIEELFKPLAVWLFARNITSPAQGFVLGVLSGAAFALFESLNASADGTTSWAVIVTARTGTSVLHMVTSGLVGWGIVSAVHERHIGRFFAAYTMAVLVHGIWNAAATGTGLSALGESLGKPEWLYNFAPAFICGLMVLGIGIIALLFTFNRKLRQQIEKEKVESPA
jgi:hypothetical protein